MPGASPRDDRQIKLKTPTASNGRSQITPRGGTHQYPCNGLLVLAGVNRKDRHVAALAIALRVDLVVTNDRRLRREIDALGQPFRALTADDFVVSLLIENRDATDEFLSIS